MSRALINDPALLILDEPTAGLDPIMRREVWEFIRTQDAKGRSVRFTTRCMDEAAALADQVLMISTGQLVAA